MCIRDSFGPVMQDVVDEGGQHGYHATQQYRKHIQRHRAQHDLVAPDEARALRDAGEDGQADYRWSGFRGSQACQYTPREDSEYRSQSVCHCFAAEAHQQPAHCRAGDQCGLENDTAQACATHEVFALSLIHI